MLRLLSRKNFGRAQEKWWLSVPEGAGSGYFPPDGDGAKCEEIREVVERTLFSDLLEPSGDMRTGCVAVGDHRKFPRYL